MGEQDEQDGEDRTPRVNNSSEDNVAPPPPHTQRRKR